MAELLKADRVTEINGVRVCEYFLTEHNPNGIAMPSAMAGVPVGVTIHNTDDIKEQADTTDPEQYTRATANGNMGTVRVHFYVDDDEAWQNLPLTQQSWHCGQKGKSDNAKSVAGNALTISIECIMDGSASEKNARAEDNCARLAAALLDRYGLGIDRLFTHNYWCNVRNGRTGTVDELNQLDDGYKNCPVYIRPHWARFKAAVEGYMNKSVSGSVAGSAGAAAIAAADSKIWGVCRWCGSRDEAQTLQGILGDGFAMVSKKG